MERLTKKSNGCFIPAVGREDKEHLLWDKLGRIEDLEEQIGCPLEVRCKLRNDGVIYNATGIGIGVEMIFENGFVGYNALSNKMEYYYYNDYKKTWWLKLDRSE